MTPKEKALEIFNRMCSSVDELLPLDVKQCALIAVDEILYVLNEIDSTEQWNASYFYNQVKQEIEKL